jgi:hypothetical protein
MKSGAGAVVGSPEAAFGFALICPFEFHVGDDEFREAMRQISSNLRDTNRVWRLSAIQSNTKVTLVLVQKFSRIMPM